MGRIYTCVMGAPCPAVALADLHYTLVLPLCRCVVFQDISLCDTQAGFISQTLNSRARLREEMHGAKGDTSFNLSVHIF